MKIQSNQLEAFYILSQERNFTKASKRIGLSQPAFSQRIQALETFLETTLVIREKGDVKLTDNGTRLLKYCTINKQLEDELISDISGNHRIGLNGDIRIAGFSSVMRSLVIPAINKVVKSNNGVMLTSITSELSELPTLLKSSKVDYILLNKPLNKEGLVSELLGHEKLVEITGKNDSEIYLDHDEFDETTINFLNQFNLPAPKKRRYLGDIYSIYDGVLNGLGNAIFPAHLIDSKKIGIKKPKRIIKSPVYLIYNKSPYYTSVQKHVINHLKVHFKKVLN